MTEPRLHSDPGPPTPRPPPLGDPLRPWAEARAFALAEVERSYLDRLLKRTGGRIGESARIAGFSARALSAKMRRHGLRKESYWGPPAPLSDAPA